MSKVVEIKDYKKIKRIGEGAFGKVYLVKKDDKEYALKNIVEIDANQSLREIDILCKLDHPAIIKLYGYHIGKKFDKIITITEYMRNGSLKQVIDNEFRHKRDDDDELPILNLTQKFKCVYGIAKGMEYCHKNNILHRDLKPDNILLNDNFEPCITDFGLSKITDVATAITQSCAAGTGLYRAPEMINENECDEKCDVYSYGCIIYFIFSGQDPPFNFSDDKDREVITSDLPEDVQFLISECCNSDVEERAKFKDITEFCAESLVYIDGFEQEAYTEYVNRLNNYSSSTNNKTGLILDESSMVGLNFSVYIRYKKKNVSMGDRFLSIVKKISSDQMMVTQKRNIYLLKSFPGVNEKKFIPKIIRYSKLNHFAILKLKGVALSNDKHATFILKNKVSNGSLTDIITNEKEGNAPSDWTMTKKIITLYGVAKAMAYLHSKNIFAQNLCPNNIFFDWDFYPYITNFETLIDLDDDWSNYNDYYDFDYNCLDPQINQKKKPNEKTDVYSFSIITYYIFATEYPFSRFSLRNRLLRSMKGFRDTFPKGFPSIFQPLVHSCWSRNQNERPTFNEIAKQITELAEKFDHENFDINEFKSYVEKVERQEEISPIDGDYYKQDIEKILDDKINEGANKLINDGIEYQKESEGNNELIEKAFECYQKAAETKGSLSGNYHLGLMYKNGIGPINKSLPLAKINFSLAAESDEQELAEAALLELDSVIDLISNQTDEEDDFSVSQSLSFSTSSIYSSQKDVSKYSVNLSQKDVSLSFSSQLEKGENIDEDDKEKELWKDYKQAADEGSVEYMNLYGKMLYDGDQVPQNKAEAFRYFKMASDKGFIKATYNCGMMLFRGDGIPVDKEEAVKYYKKAADGNHPNALFNYSMMLKKGECVDMNKEESLVYLLKAVKKKYPPAMNFYGMMLMNGDSGVQQDKEKAADLFKQCAENGNTDAMFNLAKMLENGDGIEMDKKEAARLYKYIADEDKIEGIFHYARMLENGDGVEMNKTEAARYYKLMADRNQVDGMYHYGRMLENGDGVEKNMKEAIKYYKMSAVKKYPEAVKAYRRLHPKK